LLLMRQGIHNPRLMRRVLIPTPLLANATIDEKSVDSNSSVGQRARRKAASKALEKISEWTST